ncbi:hypothetical protein BR93DRAFT_362015 [Coniochaeta sp. PMI_546]|nr:hypothetical protein BR93DRAFT_362015 [Coniochaeta sp. PMI_546]
MAHVNGGHCWQGKQGLEKAPACFFCSFLLNGISRLRGYSANVGFVLWCSRWCTQAWKPMRIHEMWKFKVGMVGFWCVMVVRSRTDRVKRSNPATRV